MILTTDNNYFNMLDFEMCLKCYPCTALNFKRRIKCRLPFAGIIRTSPYSIRFQDKG